MCYQILFDSYTFLLSFVVIFNFSVEMELLSNLFSNMSLDGDGYDEVPAQRRLIYEEEDMKEDNTSSLGC